MDNVVTILPFVGIAVLFWLILIRPAQRRQRELGQMQRAVEVGDEVMLTSGIYGTVRALHNDTMSLELAEGVTVRVVRAAIGSVVTPVAVATDEEAGLVSDGPEEK